MDELTNAASFFFVMYYYYNKLAQHNSKINVLVQILYHVHQLLRATGLFLIYGVLYGQQARQQTWYKKVIHNVPQQQQHIFRQQQS